MPTMNDLLFYMQFSPGFIIVVATLLLLMTTNGRYMVAMIFGSAFVALALIWIVNVATHVPK